MRRPPSAKTLETIVVATSLLIACALVGFWVWMARTAREARLDDTKVKVENLSTTIGTHAQRSIEAADLVLRDMVERVEHDGFEPAAMARLSRHLKGLLGGLKTISTFIVFDSDGNLRASSSGSASSVNVRDRDYFRFHRDDPRDVIHIDKPIGGRGEGRNIFPVTRVIKSPDGRFLGVAFAGLLTDAFQKYFDSLDTGQFGVMRLALESGTILIRKPYTTKNVGRNVAATTKRFGDYLQERDAGVVRTTSPVDGVVRWTSIHSLPSLPLVSAASLSETEELASWRRETRQQAVAIVAILLSIAGFCVFLVTEIRRGSRMQQSQEQTAAQLRAITDNLPALISYVDAERKVRFINKTGEHWHGKPAQEIIGQTVSDELQGLPSLDSLAHSEGLPQGPVRYEGTRRARDGSLRIIDGVVVPDTGTDGTLRGYYNLATDVTEQRTADDRLRQAQKMETIGQLTGGVAHDFNNLLTVLLGNAELLAEELPENGRHRKLAETTRDAAQRGADLTHRLLAFARRQALAPRPFNVNELVTAMDGLLRRTLNEDIEIEFVRGAGLWDALADSSELEGALLNLCINARDAMKGGGRLTIETANARLDEEYAAQHAEVRPGQYVMIAVSDTGTGIPADILDRVYDPFFTTKEVGKGTGLGLSMVYGFVKQSSGHVKIYSELDQGTTVKIYLPRADKARAASSEPPAPVPHPTGSEKILVVEDDDLVRQHAESQLVALGYRVISASTAPEALEVIRRTPDIDLLFTDVIMPGGMNGRELADAARALRPTLKVLFTSGYTENAIVHHGRLDQGVHLLNKPYRRADLAKKVRAVLAEEG